MYYFDKIQSLKEIFGATKIEIGTEEIIIDGKTYPILNDVIIILEEKYLPKEINTKIATNKNVRKKEESQKIAQDIQFTFSKEWEKFPEILPEHKKEFEMYFDLVDINSLSNKRIADFGCGIGRWSYFLKDMVKEIILIDFSTAIFIARKNLKNAKNALFFMADIQNLPFKENFADFIFSLGVLHHLENNALEEVKNISKYAPQLLVFLYYKLDNRPFIWRFILGIVTLIRKRLCSIKSEKARNIITYFLAISIYLPLIYIGKFINIFNLGKHIPLYDFYHDKTFKRILQDVYDRFFTRIENRYTRKEIMELKNFFKEIKISDNLPYWHFLCKK